MDHLKYLILYNSMNVFSIIIMLVLLRNMKKTPISKQTVKFLYRWLILFAVLFCASDMVAVCLEGLMFPGCRVLLYLADTLFMFSGGAMAMLWLRYVYLKMGMTENIIYKSDVIGALPLGIIAALLIANLFTGWIFYFDENNIYHRGNLVILHWAICFFYVMLASLNAIAKMSAEKNRAIRDGYKALFIFSIPTVIALLIQISFAGINTMSGGFTISAIMVYLHSQQAQISLDQLTGLNNRGAMNRYIDSTLGIMQLEDPLYLLMIDVNHFKRINDEFGHLVGDQALVDTANILKTVCGKMQGRLFLARYGGDEFVIAGLGRDPGETAVLKQFIREESEHMNVHNGQPYTLEMSVGVASGTRLDFSNSDDLISIADANMYTVKKESR